MDLLRAMTVFVRVVETGSLSTAGRDLGVSQPAVSQQVSALERHLNLRLINRTTRQLTLTEAGADYYRKAQTIIEAVREAGETAAGLSSELMGNLRIHAPVGFGQTYVGDIAIGFQKIHPGVTVELILDDPFVDLTAKAVDVAIRFGNLVSSGLVARRLGTLRRIIVAAPHYIAANGSPETPDALSRHRQVQFNDAPDGHVMPLIGPSGPVMVPVTTIFRANNAFVLTKALAAGLGVGGAQLPLIQTELKEGSLVRVMKDFEYAPLEVHAIYPSARFVPAKVRAFVEHLEQSLKGVW